MSINWGISCHIGVFVRFNCYNRSPWLGYVISWQASCIFWYAPRWHLLVYILLWDHEPIFSNCYLWDKGQEQCCLDQSLLFLLICSVLTSLFSWRGRYKDYQHSKTIKIGANPIPIILAETIIGLDNFKEQNRLFGSLLLL